jgi:hypothetical protein
MRMRADIGVVICKRQGESSRKQQEAAPGRAYGQVRGMLRPYKGRSDALEEEVGRLAYGHAHLDAHLD